MDKPVIVIQWLLLTLGLVAAQTENASKALPNWLTGIIAVAVFLFLVFVTFLVNKAWCNNSREAEAVGPYEYAMTNGSPRERHLDAVRSADPHAYENVGIEHTDEKITEM